MPTVHPHHFPFELAKAIQAMGVLHSSHGAGRVGYYRLLKLLYIANREYLMETGRPIVGGKNVAMDRGPLNSPIYSLIKGEHPDSPIWCEYFTKDKRHLYLNQNPGNDELSGREIKKLQAVSALLEELDDDEVGEVTHGFVEYRNNHTPGTSTPIELDEVLVALGMEGQRERIRADIDQIVAMKQLFGN